MAYFYIFENSVFRIFKRIIVVQLLLLLSHFSHVRLCATPQTAAHQALLSLGFSRQEYWSVHFLLQCMKVKSESEVAQLRLTLHDLMDCSLLGFSIHGIFQARVLEWGAIAFSVVVQRESELIRAITLNHRKAETPGSLIQVTVVPSLPLCLFPHCAQIAGTVLKLHDKDEAIQLM